MTDNEILQRVKTALGYTGQYNDEMLKIFIADIRQYMLDAGVKQEIVNTDSAIGAYIRGVADTMNYGSGTVTLSPYFKERVIQMATGNLTPEQAFLPITGGEMQGDIDMSAHKIENLGIPENDYDAARKADVDEAQTAAEAAQTTANAAQTAAEAAQTTANAAQTAAETAQTGVNNLSTSVQDLEGTIPSDLSISGNLLKLKIPSGETVGSGVTLPDSGMGKNSNGNWDAEQAQIVNAKYVPMGPTSEQGDVLTFGNLSEIVQMTMEVFLPLSGGEMQGNIGLKNNQRITDAPLPTEKTDLASKQYVDQTVGSRIIDFFMDGYASNYTPNLDVYTNGVDKNVEFRITIPDTSNNKWDYKNIFKYKVTKKSGGTTVASHTIFDNPVESIKLCIDENVFDSSVTENTKNSFYTLDDFAKKEIAKFNEENPDGITGYEISIGLYETSTVPECFRATINFQYTETTKAWAFESLLEGILEKIRVVRIKYDNVFDCEIISNALPSAGTTAVKESV